MPRPETFADLDHHQVVKVAATFHVDAFVNDPHLIKLYGEFLARVTQLKGGAQEGSNTYNMNLEIPLSEKELDDKLKSAQASWDALDRRYLAISQYELDGETLDPAYKEYEGYGIRNHAEREGYPQLSTTEKAS